MNRSKNIFKLLFTSVTLIFMYGCPYHSNYQLDETPQLAINTNYLGSWRGVAINEVYKNATDVEVIISPLDDFQYEILFIGKFNQNNLKKRKRKKNIISTDTIKATAFESVAEGRQFLNIMFNYKTYLSEIKYQNDQLSLLPIGEGFTNFIIRSNAQLRERIEFHFHTRLYPSYDESFCLRNMKRK